MTNNNIKPSNDNAIPPPSDSFNLNGSFTHPLSTDHPLQHPSTTNNNTNPNSARECVSHRDSGGSIATTTSSSSSTTTITTTTSTSTSTPHNILPSLFAPELPLMLSQPPPPRVVVPTLFSDNVQIDSAPSMTGQHCRVPDRITLSNALRCHSRWDDMHSATINPFYQDEFASYFGHHPQRRCRSLPEILNEVLEISEITMANLSERTVSNNDLCNNQRVSHNDNSLLMTLPHHSQLPPESPAPTGARVSLERRQRRRRHRSSISRRSRNQNRRPTNNDDSSHQRRTNESQ